MKSKTLLLLCFSLCFFSKTYSQHIPEITDKTVTVIGMVLLSDNVLLNYEAMKPDLLDTWEVAESDIDGNDQTISFTIDGATFLVGCVPAQVPGEDLNNAIEMSYLWKDARSANKHQSHVIIAVVGELPPLDLYRQFTTMAGVIIINTKSIGVFLQSQSLALSKEFFLQNTATMNEETLPLYNWIYFGRKPTDQGNSAYTYGLKEFGLEELEIVDSQKSMEEVMSFIYQVAHYVVAGDVILNEGETVGPEDEKIKVSISNGANLEGRTIKIDY